MTKEEELQLYKRIELLEEFAKRLNNNSTIPFDVGEAFKRRLGSLKDIATKTAASETQAVNEAGASMFSVAAPMDGFYRTADGKNIPYYDD